MPGGTSRKLLGHSHRIWDSAARLAKPVRTLVLVRKCTNVTCETNSHHCRMRHRFDRHDRTQSTRPTTRPHAFRDSFRTPGARECGFRGWCHGPTLSHDDACAGLSHAASPAFQADHTASCHVLPILFRKLCLGHPAGVEPRWDTAGRGSLGPSPWPLTSLLESWCIPSKAGSGGSQSRVGGAGCRRGDRFPPPAPRQLGVASRSVVSSAGATPVERIDVLS